MRILHTSDWHLGASLGGFSRLDEQRAILCELCRLARDKNIDVVLVVGDIYDSFTPAPEAEQLFFDTMNTLSHEGIACVALAGNRDNPDRLCAARSFAGSHGIYIIGRAGETPQGEGIIESAPNFLRIRPARADCDCAIAALPYTGLGRLGGDGGNYSHLIGDMFHRAGEHFKPEYVNIAMAHLFAKGGQRTGVERRIEGADGSLCVEAEDLCPEAQYVALGHLHKAQCVGKARYAGSILQQDFSESGQLKQVVIADIAPRGAAQISEIPLICGRYLSRWHVGSVAEARALIESGQDAKGWIDLTIESGAPPSEREMLELSKARERMVRVHWQGISSGADNSAVDWVSRPKQELFEAFYRQMRNHAPSREVTELFLELMGRQEGEGDETSEADV